MIPVKDWKWFGYPGHFICSEHCTFHLCTLVGQYVISTVGHMHFGDSDERQKVGTDLYETMVFSTDGASCTTEDCNCGLPGIKAGDELDCWPSHTGGEAQAKHMELCHKWAKED